MTDTAPRQTGGAAGLLGDFAPKMVELTDDLLFADVWNRPELTPRDRSLVTVSALITSGDATQLKAHIGRALDNGVTVDEIKETVTHLAFYAGWPKGMTAMGVLRDVVETR